MNRSKCWHKRTAVLAGAFLVCVVAAAPFLRGAEWNADASVTNLALFPWGEPQFTDGALNTYPRPAYILAALAEGGCWVTNDTWYGWQPSLGDWQPDLATNRLFIHLDRAQAPSNLWLSVVGVGDPAAALLAGFYDNDLLSVAEPLILRVVDAGLFTNRIDLLQAPSASIIALSATNGMVRILSSVLDQEHIATPAMIATPHAQTKTGGTAASPSAMAAPTARAAITPLVVGTTLWYVNGANGSDSYDGAAEAFVPSTTTGPKKSIAGVLASAKPGDTICVAAGVYSKSLKLTSVRMITKGRVVLQ